MRNSDNVGKGGLRLLKAQQRKPTTEEATNAESSLHLCEGDLDQGQQQHSSRQNAETDTKRASFYHEVRTSGSISDFVSSHATQDFHAVVSPQDFHAVVSPVAIRAFEPKSLLQIRVVAAQNLPATKGLGMWSCFCIARLGKQEKRTYVSHGGCCGYLSWADEPGISLSVFDRSQLCTLVLMAYNAGAEPSEIGRVRITPVMGTTGGQIANEAQELTDGCATKGKRVVEATFETSRFLSLLAPNGRVLYGRDGKR